MIRSAFGHREATVPAHSQAEVLRVHAAYTHAHPEVYETEEPKREGSPFDRSIAWVSYYTLVFTTMTIFAPDSAAAAVLTVRGIVA